MILKEEIKNFKRSWVHHSGMQLATLVVLASTFSVVAFFATVSFNMQKLLTSWGENIQLTLYLKDDVDAEKLSLIQDKLSAHRDLASVHLISKEQATEIFRTQMASYAPDLLQDSEFANPFPASLQVDLKPKLRSQVDEAKLDSLVAEFKSLPGVDEVSYGQGWVKTYAAFVGAISKSTYLIISILIFGSLLVIGNSIRASISHRRDEIEIMELVGATASMIRLPYVFEGALMGTLAAGAALVANYVLFTWLISLMETNIALARLAPSMKFMTAPLLTLFVLAGTAFGSIGAFLTVRKLNDGWAASQGIEP